VGAHDVSSTDFPERVQLQHNALLWMVTTSVEEKLKGTRVLIEKLNRTSGPTGVVFPLRAADGVTKYGLDDPEGTAAVRKEMKENLKPDIPFVEVDCSLDDLQYADEVIGMLDKLTR
jgi:uncharacterized protein (UPF0261 family)